MIESSKGSASSARCLSFIDRALSSSLVVGIHLVWICRLGQTVGQSADARCGCLGEGHPDSVFRSQDHHRTRFDHLVRSQLKVVFSEQNTKNQQDLKGGVVTADT